MVGYMLGANHGFTQSMNCAVQSVDPCFVQAIHALRYISTILKLCKLQVACAWEVILYHVKGCFCRMASAVYQRWIKVSWLTKWHSIIFFSRTSWEKEEEFRAK